MKFLYFLLIPFILSCSLQAERPKCYGEYPCYACSVCSGCAHCAKEGGGCSVCQPPVKKAKKKK